LGTKSSGLTVRANTWQVEVCVALWWNDADQCNWVEVYARPYGGGAPYTLFEGTAEELLARIRGETAPETTVEEESP